MSETSDPPFFWDQRFAGADYLYGTQPNDFLAEHIAQLQGPVLSLAEGEGRNAVFMATHGLEVLGVDKSAVGLAKAERLAAEHGVQVQTRVADLAIFEPPAEHFGAVVSIFAHLPPEVREHFYPRVIRALKPGGVLLMEAYTVDQIGRGTGGPSDPIMMMSERDIRETFAGLHIEWLRELEREVREGTGHTGQAAVVQFIGRKKGG